MQQRIEDIHYTPISSIIDSYRCGLHANRDCRADSIDNRPACATIEAPVVLLAKGSRRGSLQWI
jgi:hypothetical protein